MELYWEGGRQVQEVSGGSGFAAQNQRRVHFGLGDRSQVEKLVIRWPSGYRQTIDTLELDTVNRIEEPR